MLGTVELRFIRRPAFIGGGRMMFSVPPEVARFVHKQQTYEVLLRPIGTIMVTYA